MILNDVLFRGLYLLVLDRHSLKKVFSKRYDTQINTTYTTVSASNSNPFITYSVDSSLTTWSEGSSTSYSFSNPNEFQFSHQLAT